ncbi:MAG: AAA family ATPase [Clostridia bacterium]|nr:AAA family ATPase [Clostridia bacterium]
MYISKVIIKNYRSIKDLTLNLNSGKNVIVGKNNSGKSNIIRAIDLVLGESSPTYAKYNNVIESDFYTNNSEVSNKIMIFCELAKNYDEALNIEDIIECKFYAKYVEDLYTDEKILKNKDDIYNTVEFYEREMEAKGGRLPSIYFKTKGFSTDIYRRVMNKNRFGFLFTATLNQDKIEKDLKFLVYNEESQKWTVFFSAQLRNLLLQSAIIPAFREPSQQLSLGQWSWYGKMMRILTNTVPLEKWKEYKEASQKIAAVSNDIFENVTAEINNGNFKIAFPNTKLLFKFLDDKKSELYKNAKIYIDDGFMSDISLKGAGIQSAVIISLYTYYVKNISKVKNALLCMEEPELYLHPHGKRMISNRVNDFLDAGENQAIIVTHAEEFIELKNKNSKIIKITRDSQKGSIAHEINLDKCKEVIVKNENKEIFFADKVILCEGKENLLLEFINLSFLNGKFDDENISVINVDGKGNFKKYIEIAKKINVKVYVIADFDYILRDNNEKIKSYGKSYKGDIGNLTADDLEYISQKSDNNLQSFIAKLRNQLLSFDETKFYKAKSSDDYERFLFQYKGSQYTINDCLEKIQDSNIFIEDAEVENLFKNLNHKMKDEDIYQLYENPDYETEFDNKKLKRLIEFLKKI